MKRAIEVIEDEPLVATCAAKVLVMPPAIVALMADQADKLESAKVLLAEIQRIEGGMMDLRELLFVSAWHLGSQLQDMKEDIGHGKWLVFLEGHWPQLSQQNASRYMAFFKANPNHGNSGDLTFSTESVRKFMWDYIPVKERPHLEGDAPIERITHHLTFVNVFSKWDRELSLGRVEKPPVEMLRRECEPVVKRMAELMGREYLIGLLESLPAKAAA